MQKQGGEYGVTTGRPRRCGWLDLVQLDYADQINHFTALAITKLDVMDNFETVKVCVGYKNSETGDKVACMPGQIKQLSQVVPVYEEFPGWMNDTTKCETVKCFLSMRFLSIFIVGKFTRKSKNVYQLPRKVPEDPNSMDWRRPGA